MRLSYIFSAMGKNVDVPSRDEEDRARCRFGQEGLEFKSE